MYRALGSLQLPTQFGDSQATRTIGKRVEDAQRFDERFDWLVVVARFAFHCHLSDVTANLSFVCSRARPNLASERFLAFKAAHNLAQSIGFGKSRRVSSTRYLNLDGNPRKGEGAFCKKLPWKNWQFNDWLGEKPRYATNESDQVGLKLRFARHASFTDGQDRSHLGSLRSGFYVELPAQLPHPLAHSGDAHPGELLGAILRLQPATLVGHFQRDVAVVAKQPHLSHFASRMAVHVGEAFLQHAKDRQFDEIWQLGDVGRHFQIDLYSAALRKTGQVPGNYRLQSNFVQQRWVQQVRDHTNLAHRTL